MQIGLKLTTLRGGVSIVLRSLCNTMFQIYHCLFIAFLSFTSGTLYPYDSPSRQIKTLDGLWKFRLSPSNNPDLGFNESWFSSPFEGPDILDMPVPASYNDITVSSIVRNILGWTRYQRLFQLTEDWQCRSSWGRCSGCLQTS